MKIKPSEKTSQVVPGVVTFEPKRTSRVQIVLGFVALIGYVAVARFMLGATLPALGQRLVGLFSAILAVSAYALITRKVDSTEELLYRAQLAQRSDFGKHQLEARWAEERETVFKLPVVGEVSLRTLGGVGIFLVTFLWWFTPLAPIQVRQPEIVDLTIPFAEQIVTSSLLVPDGRIAIVAPLVVPARAIEMAKRIPEGSSPYYRALKALAAGHCDEARIALNAAASERRTDALLIQIARAQTELFAGQATDAARMFETALEKKPDDVMLLLQAATAWLHAGAIDSAEPFIDRASRASASKQEKPEKHGGKDLRHAYVLHAQAMLRLMQGKQLATVEKLCAGTCDTSAEDERSMALSAASFNNEAVLYLFLGKCPGAINRFEEARYYWTKAFGPQNPLNAADFGNEVVPFITIGDYRKAAEALACAETICRESVEKEHPLTVMLQIGHALYAEAQGKYAEALTHIQNAQTIAGKALGPTDPMNVPMLDVLASLDIELGQYAKAATVCQQVLDLSRRIWGVTHPNYAQILIRRAQLCVLQKNFQDAESACTRAMDIFKQTIGKDRPEAASLLTVWGKLKLAQGKSDEAREYFEKAVKIRQETKGQKSAALACVLGDLAAVDSDAARAEDAYNQAIPMAEEMLGAEHPETALLLRGQAAVFVKQGKLDDAKAALERALAMQRKTFSSGHVELAATLEAYATVLRAATLPDAERAAKLEAEAKGMRAKAELEK